MISCSSYIRILSQVNRRVISSLVKFNLKAEDQAVEQGRTKNYGTPLYTGESVFDSHSSSSLGTGYGSRTMYKDSRFGTKYMMKNLARSPDAGPNVRVLLVLQAKTIVNNFLSPIACGNSLVSLMRAFPY
jgi:hypothetical protein